MAPEQAQSGADDGIRTRDPHLGKVVNSVRRVCSCALSRLLSAGSSAQSVETAPFRARWFNALNLCERRGRPDDTGTSTQPGGLQTERSREIYARRLCS